MIKRKIGEVNNSLLGMGCMRLPVLEDGSIDVEATKEMVDYAIKNGITYFDTAYPYHSGNSETVIGEILKNYPRDSFTLADKMPIWECKSLDDAQRIFSLQLQKCQVEYFDYYLCHAMNLERYNVYKELKVFEFLKEQRDKGIIRKLGFSFHDAAQNIIPILDELNWDFAQIQFNYLDYDMQEAKKQYEEITKHGASVVVMEPIRGGMLANVCDEATSLLKEKRPNSSIASWALRYVARFPNIKVILSGMSNMEQLVDNVNTFTNYEEMNDEEMDSLMAAKKLILGNDFIPCTGCRYCMPCPFGVNIPNNFSMYNNYGIHKDLERYKSWIAKMDEKSLPSSCKSCKACMKHCPQHIEIPAMMKKINDLIKN